MRNELRGKMTYDESEKIKAYLKDKITEEGMREGYDFSLSFANDTFVISTETESDMLLFDEFELVPFLDREELNCIFVYSEDEGNGMHKEGVLSRNGFSFIDHDEIINFMISDAKAEMVTQNQGMPTP